MKKYWFFYLMAMVILFSTSLLTLAMGESDVIPVYIEEESVFDFINVKLEVLGGTGDGDGFGSGYQPPANSNGSGRYFFPGSKLVIKLKIGSLSQIQLEKIEFSVIENGKGGDFSGYSRREPEYFSRKTIPETTVFPGQLKTIELFSHTFSEKDSINEYDIYLQFKIDGILKSFDSKIMLLPPIPELKPFSGGLSKNSSGVTALPGYVKKNKTGKLFVTIPMLHWVSTSWGVRFAEISYETKNIEDPDANYVRLKEVLVRDNYSSPDKYSGEKILELNLDSYETLCIENPNIYDEEDTFEGTAKPPFKFKSPF